MKINLNIVLLSLLLNGSVYAETLNVSEVSEYGTKNVSEVSEYGTNVLNIITPEESKSDTKVLNIITPEEVTNEWLKNKTVTDLRKLKFIFKSQFFFENNAQLFLYKTFNEPFLILYVSCYTTPLETNCRIL
jgi:hypothetical protein